MLSKDFHWTPNENDDFALMRTDEILALTKNYNVSRLHIVATDGATRYMEETVDSIDNETFQLYLKYHLSICERKDLIGASKNFTYLYEEKEAGWVLSPVYDLTFSYSIGGEHATAVDGEGKNPDIKDILAVAGQIGIKEAKARSIAEEVRDCVMEMLREYL